MVKFKIAALLSVLALFLSCSSVTIYDDYYNTADLTSYETFDWLSRRHAVVIAGVEDSPNKGLLAEEVLKESVNEQLISRGFSQSADNPDLLISYFINAQVTNNYDLLKKAGEENNRMAQQDATADIFLDFRDAKTRESLWRAAGFDIEVQNATPEKTKETIEETILKIFKKFPVEPIR
jgi:hypothetical protein